MKKLIVPATSALLVWGSGAAIALPAQSSGTPQPVSETDDASETTAESRRVIDRMVGSSQDATASGEAMPASDVDDADDEGPAEPSIAARPTPEGDEGLVDDGAEPGTGAAEGPAPNVPRQGGTESVQPVQDEDPVTAEDVQESPDTTPGTGTEDAQGSQPPRPAQPAPDREEMASETDTDELETTDPVSSSAMVEEDQETEEADSQPDPNAETQTPAEAEAEGQAQSRTAAETEEEVDRASDPSGQTADQASLRENIVTGQTITPAPGEFSIEALIGSPVIGVGDERRGTISDVVLEDEGRFETVVLSVGGVLGIGARQYPVPFDELSIGFDQNGELTVDTGLTREEIKAFGELEDDGLDTMRTAERLLDRNVVLEGRDEETAGMADLIGQLSDGEITYVILTRGGIGGLGAERRAVAFSQITLPPVDAEGEEARPTAAMTPAEFDMAPRFTARADAGLTQEGIPAAGQSRGVAQTDPVVDGSPATRAITDPVVEEATEPQGGGQIDDTDRDPARAADAPVEAEAGEPGRN